MENLMGSTVEFRVMELVCSRLCHDLISPITAVNNGMELLNDSPPEIISEIKSLLMNSAGEASRRLQFFRIAFGLGGQESSPIGLEEAGRLAHGMVDGGKIELNWPGGGIDEIGRPATKILLNVFLIGVDALPRGGSVTIKIAKESGLKITVVSDGKGARITDECLDAISPTPDIDALTARSVQAYLTKRLVSAAGGTLTVGKPSADQTTLEVALTGAD